MLALHVAEQTLHEGSTIQELVAPSGADPLPCGLVREEQSGLDAVQGIERRPPARASSARTSPTVIASPSTTAATVPRPVRPGRALPRIPPRSQAATTRRPRPTTRRSVIGAPFIPRPPPQQGRGGRHEEEARSRLHQGRDVVVGPEALHGGEEEVGGEHGEPGSHHDPGQAQKVVRAGDAGTRHEPPHDMP